MTAAFPILQRRGHSPRIDPGRNGRSLPAAPHRAQQRKNGVTAKATPFQDTYEIVMQKPLGAPSLLRVPRGVPFQRSEPFFVLEEPQQTRHQRHAGDDDGRVAPV